MSLPDPIKREMLGKQFVPGLPLVELMDKAPSDIQVRVHRNVGSRKEKEPLDVWARRYMAAHPEYYPLFAKYALDAIRRGRTNFGAKAIIERMRWDERFDGGKPFKCPNALTRFLAEKFTEKHPEHAGFFRTFKKVPPKGEQEDHQNKQ
jgi:hypothetical protein